MQQNIKVLKVDRNRREWMSRLENHFSKVTSKKDTGQDPENAGTNMNFNILFYSCCQLIQVVPGRAGGGSFRRKRNYIAKKEFACRMRARWQTINDGKRNPTVEEWKKKFDPHRMKWCRSMADQMDWKRDGRNWCIYTYVQTQRKYDV